MKRLPCIASDATTLDAVREWAALLAEERYVEAHAFLAHPPTLAQLWTPMLIATVIRNYGSVEAWSDGRTFRVTPLAEATGEWPPNQDVHRFDVTEGDEKFLGYVWFGLPLNGEWSDLTAIIHFVTDGNDIVLELNDIHVM